MSIPKHINPDLENERKRATFEVEEFSSWFYGNADQLKLKRLMEEELYKDLDDPIQQQYLSYEDTYNTAVKQTVFAIKKLKELKKRWYPEGDELYPFFMKGGFNITLTPAGCSLVVHTAMFMYALKGEGTPEQYEKFGRRANDFDILGTYAQTELGHGTYLRELETRADFDRLNDEFILNTPTLTSYKWWPGGLGQTVNYCIVVAQLYIDNVNLGMHLFLLQVRNEETHEPLPGIDIGDIGKRLSITGINNGYLGLKNVRIPRTNMLMKNAKVSRDGTYVKSPKSQLIYFPMMYIRCMIVLGCSDLHAQAATIAIRYSAVRRQSPIKPNEPEPQVLDHLTQQMKVVPEIAIAIAYRLAGLRLSTMYEETLKSANHGDYSRLTELHALSCALKASSSYASGFGIERLRLSCGGHGYLTSAHLGDLYLYSIIACTIEGENSVMYLEVGKILLKTWANILAGQKIMHTMKYFDECASLTKFPQWLGDWQCLVKALQYTSTNKTRIAFNSFTKRLNEGLSQPEALNATGIELTQAAELHGCAFVANNFFEEVTGPNSTKRSPELNQVLEHLLEVFLVHMIQRNLGHILWLIRLTDEQLISLQTRLEAVLAQLRPNLVAICDGFDFHDKVLQSVLGSYDGNVYERIFEAAKKSPLNQKTVPESFEKYLKPFMKSTL